MRKLNLTRQLLLIYTFVLGIMVISLGIILPNMLVPICETNVYSYLRQPLSFLQNEGDVLETGINTEVAYIYINADRSISISDNLSKIIDIDDTDKLFSKFDLTTDNGKFRYRRRNYYYVTQISNKQIKIAITNDSYVSNYKKSILLIIFKVIGVSLLIVSFFILSWSNHLVSRIKKIKDKIDNIDNDDYHHEADNRYNDELYTLDRATLDMHNYLMEQEEYKNQMYQNISHDFKTPIAVMTSYIEAYEDEIESEEEVMKVIKEQLKKLEIKVHSLLYLNKLNYVQDKKDYLNESYDVSLVIYNSVEKFRVSRPLLKFKLDIDKKHSVFRGSGDMWEAIIDNILNNFMRYAKSEVKIVVKANKIMLYNDGDKISDNVLNNLFTPYEKGVKGVFGLGLSIVKKTLTYLNYDIKIENVKNGVKFTIM